MRKMREVIDDALVEEARAQTMFGGRFFGGSSISLVTLADALADR